MNKSIITGYAVVAANSNGKFTGTIQFQPTGLVVNDGEMIAKIQTTKAHCSSVNGNSATIMNQFPGTVLKKMSKEEFFKKCCSKK